MKKRVRLSAVISRTGGFAAVPWRIEQQIPHAPLTRQFGMTRCGAFDDRWGWTWVRT